MWRDAALPRRPLSTCCVGVIKKEGGAFDNVRGDRSGARAATGAVARPSSLVPELRSDSPAPHDAAATGAGAGTDDGDDDDGAA